MAYTISSDGKNRQSPVYSGNKIYPTDAKNTLTLPLGESKAVQAKSVGYAQDVLYLKIKCWTHDKLNDSE